MAELDEILDPQLVPHAHDALGELHQTGAVSTADLPAFEQSLRDLLTQKGALDGGQVEAIVSAVSNEISTSHGASPVEFLTRLYPEDGAAWHLHEVSGLYYDDSGNWYNPDGTPSAYAWSAEHELFYDASSNWYNADLSPYEPPQEVEAAEASPVEAAPTSDEAVPAAPSEAVPAEVEEALSAILDEVLEKVPDAIDVSPEEFAEIFEQALLRSSQE